MGGWTGWLVSLLVLHTPMGMGIVLLQRRQLPAPRLPLDSPLSSACVLQLPLISATQCELILLCYSYLTLCLFTLK